MMIFKVVLSKMFFSKDILSKKFHLFLNLLFPKRGIFSSSEDHHSI